MELRGFTLDPNSIRDKNAPFPVFNFPEVIGYFSGLNDGSYKEDLSHLKYAFIPEDRKNLHMDLNKGLHLAKSKILDQQKPLDTLIESLLWWIKEKIGRLDRTMTDFVAYRGLLRQIMTTPYETEPWEILATAVNGVIYLCAYETEDQFRERTIQSQKQQKYMSWGFKFEQYVLSDSPGKTPDTSQPVDEREEFCCMFKSKLGRTKLMYGAEMDGVESNTPLQKNDLIGKSVKFVEVKTNRIIEHRRQQNNFERYKLIKWWGQSYLVGIKDVICGFRDDDGIVKEIEIFPTRQMHHLAKGKWMPNICMNFLEQFLLFVQEVVSTQEKEDTKIVWRFIWKPYQPVTAVREYNNEEFRFLPRWFLDLQRM